MLRVLQQFCRRCSRSIADRSFGTFSASSWLCFRPLGQCRCRCIRGSDCFATFRQQVFLKGHLPMLIIPLFLCERYIMIACRETAKIWVTLFARTCLKKLDFVLKQVPQKQLVWAKTPWLSLCLLSSYVSPVEKVHPAASHTNFFLA